MEVVIVDGPDAAGRLVGGAIADLVGAAARRRARPGHGLVAARRLRRPRPPLRRRRGVPGPCPGLPARRVRRAAPRSRPAVPGLHRPRARTARRPGSRCGAGTRRGRRRPRPARRLLGLRAGDPCRRRHRPAAPRRRRRRPHRLQRARVVAGLAHSPEDADRHDPGRQRPLLRLDRRGPPPRSDPGGRHDPRGPPPGAAGVRRGEGRGRGPGGRGAGDGDGAGVGAAAPPPRDGRRGRRRRGGLALADYYRETWAHKPGWQGV